MNLSSFFAELKWRNVYKVAVAYAILACPVMEVPTTAAPMQSPVPVEKEPRHRLKFENQFVRIFDVLIPPDDTSLFHIHVHDGVSVRLTDARIRDEALAGTSEDFMLKRGAVSFAYRPSPLIHRVSNIGSTPFRNVFVEILPSSNGSASPRPPTAVADHPVVLENERVRVRRLVLAAGQSTDARPPALRGVRVAISEGKILIKAHGEEDRTVKIEPGDSQWHEEGMKYSLKNIGSTPFEAVDIELK